MKREKPGKLSLTAILVKLVGLISNTYTPNSCNKPSLLW